MAIYHLDAKIISRAHGQSVVACAAYRAAEALEDKRYGLIHDYTIKRGVVHAEILAPDHAPDWVKDRGQLWNRVEAGEVRKDAQLAREIELGLPIELTEAENIALVRDYLKSQYVAAGMVADFTLHLDNPQNPHAHVLLTMRSIDENGFGRKVRSWNSKSRLYEWRAAWADHANEHLARVGHSVRIDHRTLAAQQIELIPGRKIGIGKERQAQKDLPRYLAERVAEQQRIAQENGELIVADPGVALRALSRQRATFTDHDIAKFLHTRTNGAEQFQSAFLKVTTASELVPLGRDEWQRTRYTTRDMLDLERSLLTASADLSDRQGHAVARSRQAAALQPSGLGEEQAVAFSHLVGAGDLKALVGVAGSGKSTLLAAAREAWEAEGFSVKGAALSGIAAQNLQAASGIHSRTLASYEYGWTGDRDPLTSKDVLVIDEAGMVGTRQLERFLTEAKNAGAKVVLVGDPEQLQAIEAGAAFRGVIAANGMAELNEVRRQREPWARQATQALATARTSEALKAYEAQGALIAADTRESARAALLEQWNADGVRQPTESRLILAFTREDVKDLNTAARAIRQERGELGYSERLATTRGERELAVNERIMFLRNEKSLGVKNGTLGVVERIYRGELRVRLDGEDNRSVVVETRDYQDFDYGYAATVHKSQGATVDRSYVLASPYFDRHVTYVALSRHRQAAALYYGRADFMDPGKKIDPAAARSRLDVRLSRARPQELAHDYLEMPAAHLPTTGIGDQFTDMPSSHQPQPTHRSSLQDLEARQEQAAQRWAARMNIGDSRAPTGPDRTGPQNERPEPGPERQYRGPELDL